MVHTNKKIKNPGGAPDQIVIQKIEIRPPNRTEQDIPNWRRSVQNAESQIPRRNKLYSLYFDVDLDGHVEAVTGKRKDPILAANWQFVDKEGAPHDEINDLIDSLGFSEMLSEIINTRFWGYTMMEPKFWKDEDGEWQMDSGLIPRLNYRPEIGVVAYDIYGNDGINIREGIYAKTVMEVGNVKDLGLYMKAAPYQILKRGGLGDYANFIQVFGHPIIDATWDGFDEKQRADLQTALNNIGAGGSIIRPDGTSVEIKENNTTASGDAQDKFLSFLNKEISKALLGTTETTESSTSSGYAQSATHLENDERKHENDLNYVRRVLNSRLRPILRAHGFDTLGGKFVIQGEDNELTKSESFEIHKGLKNELGVPIDDDFFYETYKIPKPDNYDKLKAEKNKQTSQNNQQIDDVHKKEVKKEEGEVTLAETHTGLLKLFSKLFGFFGAAPTETIGAVPQTCGCHHTIKLNDVDSFDNDALIHRVWKAEGKSKFDAELFWQTADTLIKGFKKGWNHANKVELAETPGFVYGVDDPMLLTAYEQNLFQFSGAKTLAEVAELNRLFRRAKSFEEFYQLAKQHTEIFNRDWLETEYNTANLTGEAAATYHRLMAQVKIFPYWEYKTVGDDLVRPQHRALHGLILPANDPRWKKIFPPNGWNCRCYIVPRLPHEFDKSKLKEMRSRADAYLSSPQFKKEKAQGWGVNRAELQEVFLANQQYVNKFPGKASKELNNLGFSDFELQSFSNAKKVATQDISLYNGTADDFYKKLEDLDTIKVIRDYNKRPLLVDKTNFIKHTSNAAKKREKRTELLEVMQKALLQPDEVWLQGYDMSNVTYIKYFNDATIIGIGKITNGRMELKTWFTLAVKRNVITKYRRGMLIKK